jgi:hypothetical protein
MRDGRSIVLQRCQEFSQTDIRVVTTVDELAAGDEGFEVRKNLVRKLFTTVIVVLEDC